jgi:hypothetical protein
MAAPAATPSRTLAQALMRQLAKLARLTGTFVLGIDHFGKAAETATRGSNAKEGSCDLQVPRASPADP